MRDTTQVGHPDDDPQRDVPCVDCGQEGPRSARDERGRCADCATPAGRLVTALRERGISAHAENDESVTAGGVLGVDIDDDGNWTVYDTIAGLDAADAVAAIVQAPALRAERDTLAARVAALAAERDLADRRSLHPLPDEPPAAEPNSLTSALVAQLREVEAHNARMAARLLMIADACDVMATPAATRHTLAEALPRAHADDWRETAAALRALAGGAA